MPCCGATVVDQVPIHSSPATPMPLRSSWRSSTGPSGWGRRKGTRFRERFLSPPEAGKGAQSGRWCTPVRRAIMLLSRSFYASVGGQTNHSNGLRKTPNLEVLVNYPDFHTRAGDPNLVLMSYERAAWRAYVRVGLRPYPSLR